jgi:hypothetical protein
LVLGGANNIAGACDKPLGADPNALGEGISLLTVYRVTGQDPRVVDVWAGYVHHLERQR